MEGHAQKRVERYCDSSRMRNWNQLKNCQKYAHRLSLNACMWHEWVDLTFIWSVTKLARAVTKWTRACDRRSTRLIAHIHPTSDHRQYCHVRNTAQHCRLCLFQDSDFAGDFLSQRRWIFYAFRKSNICSHKLDLQEANVSVSQSHRIGSYFFGC